MKGSRGFALGLCISMTLSAFAATVYNYFPPPGMTYTPTTGLVVGTATGGAKGAGSINAQSLFVNGAAVASSAAPGSNTQVIFNSSGAYSASSLLTFTPGSVLMNVGAATTPGTFSVGQLDAMVINGVTIPIPGFALNSNIQGVFENHSYVNGTASGGARYYGVRSEGTISSPTIVVNGDHLSTFYAAGYNGSSYSLGGALIFQVAGTPGASAMPTELLMQLSPSGSQTPATVMHLFPDAGVTVGSPTGGDQGVGTLNMQGCFVNGVACSTGGAAGGNPTGTVGLTAVNGAAGTYMRSDAAPPLSQAISPTWTGTHGFNGAYVSSTATTLTSPGNQGVTFINSTSAANAKIWDIIHSNANHLTFRAVNDAFSSADAWLDVTRSGTSISTIALGNSTDQPAIQVNGVPALTVNTVTSGFTFGGTLGQAFPVLTRYAAGSGGSDFIFYHSRGTSIGTNTILQANDEVGSVSFDGSDGTSSPARAARIIAFVDGTPSAGTSYPGRLEFYTTPAGSTNITQRVVINNAGDVSVNAPNSGIAFQAIGLSGTYAAAIGGNTTGSGLFVAGGSTSGQTALQVQNGAQNTNYFVVYGDGGAVAGNPTGGDKGLGSINAQSIFVNNVPVVTGTGSSQQIASVSGSCTSGGCTAINAKGISTTITRNSVGNYTVSFSPSFSAQPACAVSANGTAGGIGTFSNGGTASGTVVTYVSTSATDMSWDLVCTG